ncbi:MAG: hypothetical protein H8D45_18810 [Bacteroidetes bacterium]|nr:hypothetical protein [Bacteroidota bacterium]
MVVSHDAGGAEIVSSWVRRNPQHRYRFVLAGSAISIFKSKIPSIINESFSKLADSIEDSDFILTGTSESATLEKTAIKIAKTVGVKVTSFLDYWYGYLIRFQYKGQITLPDEIWVGDEYALQEAKRTFPGKKIILRPNPYLLDIAEEKDRIASKIKKNNSLNILYLCQPFDEENTGENGQTVYVTDITGLEYFFKCLCTNDYVPSKVSEIRMRMHPAEKREKYQDVLSRYDTRFTIKKSKNQSLVEDCVWSDWAVGMHSNALVVALTLGTKSFHCIPPGGKPCVLPHKEIGSFERYILSNEKHL